MKLTKNFLTAESCSQISFPRHWNTTVYISLHGSAGAWIGSLKGIALWEGEWAIILKVSEKAKKKFLVERSERKGSIFFHTPFFCSRGSAWSLRISLVHPWKQSFRIEKREFLTRWIFRNSTIMPREITLGVLVSSQWSQSLMPLSLSSNS